MSTQARIRGWMFRLDRGKGATQVVVFYGASVEEAEKHACEWANAHGYTVERVPDEKVA